MTTTFEAGADASQEASAPAVPMAARTRGLRKVYGRTVAVDHVDLDVPEGAVLGMLGPNGSGKTTTIRMLLGLVRPTEGEVELFGKRMPDEAAHALPDVGALVEGPGFHPFLSGRENLLRVAAAEPRLASAGIPGAVDAALERVGLTGAATRRYKGYSLGMKQRMGLASALLVPRRMVVLDEPTNGLDPAGTREIRRIIGELHADGVTVLVSSHLLAEVEATCTHVAVLQSGNVIAQGELSELLESGNAALLVRTPDAELAVETLRENRIGSRLTPDGVRVDLTAAEAPEVLRQLVTAGVAVHEAARARTGLEDLFARLTQPESTVDGEGES
ncbi:multidrug ABC transporter ATP-binding protein [Amycolatopsis sp. WAC 04182]|uniref:ABC-2 type transport system ATP-binding protein n=1 Tax=Amycolatopsis roodepoortensis TaxID=700274 RepID=A0ABR9L6S0_9PSEU|nr:MULTISPECIES: ABC transporter ATP-binding protein [Amycolatopsis]MBE1576042.1 ABC-2 type transport system ATP-binding protein [Amycolatopsis roodepoortensis]RSN65819.1 multidrug ABC transporter ATP-binding protein [Amycolatopsis sp. WAC 04182]